MIVKFNGGKFAKKLEKLKNYLSFKKCLRPKICQKIDIYLKLMLKKPDQVF